MAIILLRSILLLYIHLVQGQPFRKPRSLQRAKTRVDGKALAMTAQRLSPSVSFLVANHNHDPNHCFHDIPDQIRPDWEAKLAAVKAAVARRANRRIIMRQVGDRLIPIGVTSGRIHPLAEMPIGEHGEGGGEAAGGEGQRSRRSRRRQHQQGQNQDLNQLLGSMGLGGQDLEEVRHAFQIYT